MATMVQIEGPENIRGENMSLSTKVGVLLPCILQGVIQNQGQHSGPCLEAPGVCFLYLFFWLIDFFCQKKSFDVDGPLMNPGLYV